MKAHLLYRDRDFDWKLALQAATEREANRDGRRHYRPQEFNPRAGLRWNADALTTDLALGTLFSTMAKDDDCIFEVTRRVILTDSEVDADTVRYRQGVLQDALGEAATVRELYALAGQAMEKQRGHYLGTLARYPDSVLRDAVEQMTGLLEFLRKLRKIANLHGQRFGSDGWHEFFAMLQQDLGDEYFGLVEEHLNELKMRHGELISAELGKANKGRQYVLHRAPDRGWSWWSRWIRLFRDAPDVFHFELHPRDEAGAQALNTLRNRGIALAANALGQAADHVREFFGMLRAELAFYVGSINLHERLTQKGEPTCFPRSAPPEARQLSFGGLYDVCLTLSIDARVVGNDANADMKGLVIITGPNTGGKSTFLRSVGLAQLMMQSGMFAPAESLRASLCHGLFTHFRREEDAGMVSGKFDEELGRMSEIIDHIVSGSMVLLNESFAATNEREGSEIARQIIAALLERGVRIACVTHMYELAHGFHERSDGNMLFLRAERQTDGSRTFKLIEGEPMPTSFGEDLYNRIFLAETWPSEGSETSTRARAHS